MDLELFLATITVDRFPFFVQCKLLVLAEATVTKLRLASRGIASVPPPRHQHPRCFHCVPCQQLTEDNPHTHTHTHTPHTYRDNFRCDRTWRYNDHSPGACSGVCPSVYPHVSSVPRGGGPHTHTLSCCF